MPAYRLKSDWFGLALIGLLGLVAIAKYRHGIVRVEGIDLAVPYAGARVWLAGGNPYDGDLITRAFHEAGGASLEGFNLKHLPPVYPPTTYLLMTPIALLRWEQAVSVWEFSAIFMVAILIGMLVRLADLRFSDPRVILFALFCIVFAPLRSAVTLGQNALPATCLALLAVLVMRQGQSILAGVLLAISIGLKVQDGLFVLAFFSLARRWKAIGSCIGTLGLLLLVVTFRRPWSEWTWIFDVLDWIRLAAAPGAIIDPAAPNGARFQMLHLPVLLSTFLPNARVVSVLNVLISGSLGAVLLRRLLRQSKNQASTDHDLLALAGIAAFSLLPTYHRFPDGVLLLIAMVWGISMLDSPPNRWLGRITLLILLFFLIQPYDLLPSLMRDGRLSRETFDSWWFQCFVRASTVWALMALIGWLIFALGRKTSDGSGNASLPSPSAVA